MENEKHSLLIIDDSKANIIALSHILSDTYNLLAAKSASAGIEIASSQQPDMILLDIIMPDMDGYEALAVLKSNPATSKIPVIFISGLDSPEDEEKGLSLGAVDYIIKPFNASVVKLRIATQIKALSQVQSLETASITDALTGLPNRAAINRYLESSWKESTENNTQLAIMVLDIDNFKSINDTYGHLHGDDVLKYLAKVLTKSLKRSNDFTGRYGGEEFIVVLKASNQENAMTLANSLLRAIKDPDVLPFEHSLTASAGVYSAVPTDSSSIKDFFEMADKALYVAKRTGKDRAVFYTADME